MIKFGKKNKKSKKEEIEEESSSEEEEGSSKKVLTLADMLSGKEQPMPESRSIMFVGEVTEERAADLVSALIVLAQTKEEDQEKPDDIKLYMSPKSS